MNNYSSNNSHHHHSSNNNNISPGSEQEIKLISAKLNTTGSNRQLTKRTSLASSHHSSSSSSIVSTTSSAEAVALTGAYRKKSKHQHSSSQMSQQSQHHSQLNQLHHPHHQSALQLGPAAEAARLGAVNKQSILSSKSAVSLIQTAANSNNQPPPPPPPSSKLTGGANIAISSGSQRVQHPQSLDRSDSASLPSSTSTSESMFKRRLGGRPKWQRLFVCGSSRDDGDEPGKFTPLAYLLFILILLFAILALLAHFKLFGLSISCSFYGNNKQQEGFNFKNGAEYYMGITEMLQAMDSTIDPCHDFYNYACGAWTRRHSIPGDESRIDTFSVMRSDLGNKLKDLLEEDIDPSDSEAAVKAKTLYRSCVNETLIDKRGPAPLIDLLNSKFGGWPLLTGDFATEANSINNKGSEIQDPMNWVQLMAVLRTYNNEIIIGQTVGSHEHNSSMHAIRLYPAGLGLPSADYYNFSSRQFKAYEKYLISTAKLLGANNSNLMSDIGDILEFETGLANISKPFEKQGGATYHRMTVARLQKYTPAIDWDTYFKYSFPDLQINSTEQIGLYGLDFFMDIAHLINTTASKKTVINYLLWRFVMNRVNNLGKQFADNQHEYAAEISGAKIQAPRHKVCVDYVNGNMGMAVSSLYVKRHFDQGSKQQAEIMIANIRQAFLDILEQVDWMDLETRQEAIVKAKSMLQHIGFPLWIIDSPILDLEYQHLQFTPDNYFENVIQLIQSFAKETRTKLRQPSERDKWTVAPSIINAHYLRTKNLMSFPAGILQPPIYHTRYPKSLNYGGIGSIIGHEITHGFDNDGRHHDYQGNQRLWWHPNTIDRFIVRSQCMVRQYDDYSVDIKGENITVSGIRTLGENIADNGGLKEAFMAYRRYEQENGPEDSLPGLNLTHHQMFFIKFAQNWCQNMTPQSMMNALKTWRHPLGRFRVIGTLSNLNEFSTAFNCPANTPMNPTNKCKVW